MGSDVNLGQSLSLQFTIFLSLLRYSLITLYITLYGNIFEYDIFLSRALRFTEVGSLMQSSGPRPSGGTFQEFIMHIIGIWGCQALNNQLDGG